MYISSSYYNQKAPSFGVNLSSPKLNFERKDFFIKIKGYGRNKIWADEIIKKADVAVNLLRNESSVENVLKCVAAGVRIANQNDENLAKRSDSGILRIKRENWIYDDKEYGKDYKLATGYINSKYSLYETRFDKTYLKPIRPINKNIGMTICTNFHILEHGHWSKVNDSLDYIFNLSNKLFPKYVQTEVKPENLDEVNSTIAEIRWVLAHSTPWFRGSDAIANVFMRVMYKAMGIKCYPPAKNISFDLEAYCTELEDYKKNFTTYFTKPPEIIE